MQGNRVCVGGVDLDNRRSLRLLDCDGKHETINDCPYELLEVWNIDYNRTYRRSAPHLEDVNVIKRNRTSYNEVDPQELIKLSRYNINVYRTSLLDTFEGELRSTDNGSLYISEYGNIPNFSTCFWWNDKPLRKNRFSTEEKIKFDYKISDNKWYHIAYVGLEDMPDIIPQGTLIRLSLAHWWRPDELSEKRCYLQLSGIYTISKDEGDKALKFGPNIVLSI